MKPTQKANKSPYNPPVKLRAEILPEKLLKSKKQSSSESSSESDESSYDSEVQEFANEFYDDNVKQADKQLHQKKDNLTKTSQQTNQNKQNNKNDNQKQNKKIKKSPTQQDKLALRLNELKANFSDLDIDSMFFKKKNEKKLKQIAQFLSRKHKQKRDFMRKLKKIKNSGKEKRKIEQEMSKKQAQQQHSKRLKQIRQLSVIIKAKIEKKKQEEEQKLQDIEAFYENFHKKYRKEKLYKIMELSEKKRRNKEIQKQNQYLKQRKQQFSQIISAEDISDFKKRREELMRDLQKVKHAEKEQKNSQLSEKNRQLRERIYIGSKYLQIQEEQIKKEKIRQIPKQKLDKIKKYDSYVKENFLPASNRSEDDEKNEDGKEVEEEQKIFQINGKLYTKIKKPRYLKGLKIGEVTQNVPLPKTEQEIKIVGNSYLQQLKLLPRKKHSQSLDLSRKSEQKPKPMTSRVQIPKVARKMGRISLSKNPDRHEIQGLISSLKARDGVIERKQHYLKVLTRGDNGSNPQKQGLDEDLLDNIERKINLLGKL